MGVRLDFQIDQTMLARLEQRLGSVPELIDSAVEDLTTTVKKLVEGRTPIDNVTKVGRAKSQSEHAKYSWEGPVSVGDYSYSLENTAKYARVLDEGRYKGVGPRTVSASDPISGSSGIYSRQAPGGMVSPVFKDINLDGILEYIMSELEKI